MASTLTGSQSNKTPHSLDKRYEIALDQSIEALLSSLRSTNPRSSINFASEFQQFVQGRADPPLESIWVYTALTFTCPTTPKNGPFSRISDIKDLFQLIVSCSASCDSIKSIALVAPVIYNLHNLILDVKGFQLGSKKEKKVNGEIRCLVDSILGYVSVCCSGFDGDFDESKGLIRPLSELISLWLVDYGVGKMNAEYLRTFFPLLSNGTVNKASVQRCVMVDLAGFVVAELFLLKLCWKIRAEGFGERMQNELRSWMVGSITGLSNSYFYATALSMLLEPVLPVTSLLNVEHEVGLRKVLFDALILVEYSFMSPESIRKLPVQHAKRIILAKLLVTHEAIKLFRGHRDQTKAIPYINAFASSSLPSLITKWLKSETGNEFSLSEPTGSSPKAFLGWLLNIENRGIKIFDDDTSELCAAFNSKEASEQILDGEEEMKRDSNLVFYIDHKGQEEYGSGEDEMRENMSSMFTAAAHSMQSAVKGGRKRKTEDGEERNQVKFVKYKAVGHSSLSRERSADARSDHLDSGSDLENPSSDDDIKMRGRRLY